MTVGMTVRLPRDGGGLTMGMTAEMTEDVTAPSGARPRGARPHASRRHTPRRAGGVLMRRGVGLLPCASSPFWAAETDSRDGYPTISGAEGGLPRAPVGLAGGAGSRGLSDDASMRRTRPREVCEGGQDGEQD